VGNGEGKAATGEDGLARAGVGAQAGVPSLTPEVRAMSRLSARLSRHRGSLIGVVVIAGLLAWYVFTYGGALAGLSFVPHAPDMALLLAQPLTVQLHIAAALTALLIGLVLLAGTKGNTLHRTLGWIWVVAMMTTAVSSFFIRTINPGALSWIHLISGWTVIALPMAVHAARRHRVAAHRQGMTGLFVGGLLIAGALTFLPGRLMWRVVFG
tara:strand:- start:1169 stop:1801 length:633 start_codon:yes stop_codon:yes gene_type:complete